MLPSWRKGSDPNFTINVFWRQPGALATVSLDAVFERFTSGRVFTPKLWTDAYLASYAQVSGLVLVTFDQGFRQFDSLACHVLAAG